jgi:NAD(P)-dependent dehydrogenase (short-subunit alcohol dehydrogenase family)
MVMDLELSGKSVIVTGGGSNIGRAIVLAYAAEGANVTVGDWDDAQAETVAELARSKGGAVQVVKCDVTDMDQVKALFQAAVQKYGTVDILVNNVGWDELKFFTQTDRAFWDKIIARNFLSVANCTTCALEVMIPNNIGSIVSISSDASRMGEPREAVYGAMKAGVNSLMKSVARENGRNNIRCNVVCPGVTVPSKDEFGESSMWSKDIFTDEQFERVAKSLPLRRVGRPSDIAPTVLFVSSPCASYMTGQVISVSGGYSMIG